MYRSLSPGPGAEAPFRGSIGLGQIAFFVDRDSGEAVVGRIAQYHQDGLRPLDAFGGVALLQKFGNASSICGFEPSGGSHPVRALVR